MEDWFKADIEIIKDRISKLPNSKYKHVIRALELIEHSERIDSLPFMKILDDEEKAICFRELTWSNLKEININDNLFEPSEDLKMIYFITSGLIKLSGRMLKEDTCEMEKTFQLLSVGDILGELELFETHKTICSATAVLKNATCICIDRIEFRSLIEKVPNLFKWVYKQLAFKVIRQGVEWNSQDEFTKLLFALVIICDNPAFKYNDKKTIIINANHTELGSIFGIHRNKISNHLKKIQEETDSIIMDRDQITIVDPIKLKDKCKEIDKEGIFTEIYNRM